MKVGAIGYNPRKDVFFRVERVVRIPGKPPRYEVQNAWPLPTSETLELSFIEKYGCFENLPIGEEQAKDLIFTGDQKHVL